MAPQTFGFEKPVYFVSVSRWGIGLLLLSGIKRIGQFIGRLRAPAKTGDVDHAFGGGHHRTTNFFNMAFMAFAAKPGCVFH